MSIKGIYQHCTIVWHLSRPANLWSSKTVFFNPKSCFLLTKVVFLKKTWTVTRINASYSSYIQEHYFMDHWLNMHDFVIDEPMNIPKLQMWDACRILYRTEWAFCHWKWHTHTHVFYFLIFKSYFIEEIRNTTKSYWLAGLSIIPIGLTHEPLGSCW